MQFLGLYSKGSKVNQVLCAVLINLPVFAYGASIGWMSPMSLLLQSDHSPKGVPLTDTEVSLMAALPYMVCVPFDIIMAMISDKFGRKKALLLISLGNASSWLLLLCSTETWALVLARALVGVPMAGSFVTCPMYTKEISEDNIRGALGCLVILFQTGGNLFLYVIGDLLSYHTINWICFSIPIVHIIAFLAMPESPSYLVKKGKFEEASKAMAWLRCRSEQDSELLKEVELISKEQKNDEGANSFLLKSIFSNKVLTKAFIIAMIATLAREVCGAVPVLNFAGEIFTLATKDTGLIISPNQQAMVLGSVQVIGSALAFTIVEKTGRKPLLFISSLVSGLSMCTLASWFVLKDYAIFAPSWLPLLTLCLCVFCDASGLQPISIVLTGEIFSFKYRGTVLAVTMAAAALADFLQLLFFKPLANSVGIHASFYFFGIVCLFMAVYVVLVIPETKARKLEDIYNDLVKKTDKDNADDEIKSNKYHTEL